MLDCRNCGGKLVLGESAQEILCENCDARQMLQSIIDVTEEPIYVVSEEVNRGLNTYRRAMNMYARGESIREIDTAMQMFKNIPRVLNAKDMVQRCQQRRDLLVRESNYQKAMEDMQSQDSQRIRAAVETLHQLEDYKDSSEKEAQARGLLETALHKEQTEAFAQKKAKRAKQLAVVAALAVVVLIIIGSVIGKAVKYNSKNLTLTLTPCSDYLTVKNSRYIFYYSVSMENSGSVDIKAFDAEVVIEDHSGKVLVDTWMRASDATALVREGKNREMNWELTVNDENVAVQLYENFDDLKVSITITQIEFADGEIKDYK